MSAGRTISGGPGDECIHNERDSLARLEAMTVSMRRALGGPLRAYSARDHMRTDVSGNSIRRPRFAAPFRSQIHQRPARRLTWLGQKRAALGTCKASGGESGSIGAEGDGLRWRQPRGAIGNAVDVPHNEYREHSPAARAAIQPIPIPGGRVPGRARSHGDPVNAAGPSNRSRFTGEEACRIVVLMDPFPPTSVFYRATQTS